jgi:hypothetical protein
VTLIEGRNAHWNLRESCLLPSRRIAEDEFAEEQKSAAKQEHSDASQHKKQEQNKTIRESPEEMRRGKRATVAALAVLA